MRKLFILCILSASLGGLTAAIGWHDLLLTEAQSVAQEQTPWSTPDATPTQPLVTPEAYPTPDHLTPDERVNVFVYQQVNRSVANINTKSATAYGFLTIEPASKGEGSATVIDRVGHLLTNYHVVEGADEIRATLYDGRTYDAHIVGADPATDVAVLKIDAPADSLFPVVFGSSTNLLVGLRVFAIGNPFGLERTLTTGVISSLNRLLPGRRSPRTLKSIIQIDAAVNPGNSGGPLLDSRAKMIGMNTAIASKTGESAGVGFAIPINTIARVVLQLIKNGRVRRPESGIAKVYQTDHGLLIAAPVPAGPAERAGLQGPRIEKRQKRQGPFVHTYQTIDRAAADMIIAVDSRPIKTADDFLTAIDVKQPGDQVTLTVIRAGQKKQILLRLEAAP